MPPLLFFHTLTDSLANPVGFTFKNTWKNLTISHYVFFCCSPDLRHHHCHRDNYRNCLCSHSWPVQSILSPQSITWYFVQNSNGFPCWNESHGSDNGFTILLASLTWFSPPLQGLLACRLFLEYEAGSCFKAFVLTVPFICLVPSFSVLHHSLGHLVRPLLKFHLFRDAFFDMQPHCWLNWHLCVNKKTATTWRHSSVVHSWTSGRAAGLLNWKMHVIHYNLCDCHLQDKVPGVSFVQRKRAPSSRKF